MAFVSGKRPLEKSCIIIGLVMKTNTQRIKCNWESLPTHMKHKLKLANYVEELLCSNLFIGKKITKEV